MLFILGEIGKFYLVHLINRYQTALSQRRTCLTYSHFWWVVYTSLPAVRWSTDTINQFGTVGFYLCRSEEVDPFGLVGIYTRPHDNIHQHVRVFARALFKSHLTILSVYLPSWYRDCYLICAIRRWYQMPGAGHSQIWRTILHIRHWVLLAGQERQCWRRERPLSRIIHDGLTT